jgi:hypothetical protein
LLLSLLSLLPVCPVDSDKPQSILLNFLDIDQLRVATGGGTPVTGWAYPDQQVAMENLHICE